jgi:antirestriction protein ArdC
LVGNRRYQPIWPRSFTLSTSRLLQVLKNDSRAIFTAASKAQAAADWMHAQQP